MTETKKAAPRATKEIRWIDLLKDCTKDRHYYPLNMFLNKIINHPKGVVDQFDVERETDKRFADVNDKFRVDGDYAHSLFDLADKLLELHRKTFDIRTSILEVGVNAGNLSEATYTYMHKGIQELSKGIKDLQVWDEENHTV